MREDRRYLEQHRGKWRVRVAVPKHLKELYERHHIVVSLNTHSLPEANKLKRPVLDKIREQFEFATRDWKVYKGEAEFQERAKHLHSMGVIRDVDFDKSDEDTAEAIELLVHEVTKATNDPLEARRIKLIAQGRNREFLPLFDQWMQERSSMKPRQRVDYRRAITKFAEFEPRITEVTRRKAGLYIQDQFISRGVHPRTTNKDVSCLSSFWRWLEKRGYHDGPNPWLGQTVGETSDRAQPQQKRPFTDDEVSLLVSKAPEGSLIGDAIRIAALSGMRVSEIACLLVGDVAGGVFRIREAKTAAGRRAVPIHSALKALVDGRCNGKAVSDRLFDELPKVRENSAVEPGQAITKKFGRFREKLGISEKVGAARQSNVDFHSFRRWFITKAEGAGQPPHIIEAVVGHKRAGMTLGTYSGGPSPKQMKKCVEAVKLPVAPQGKD